MSHNNISIHNMYAPSCASTRTGKADDEAPCARVSAVVDTSVAVAKFGEVSRNPVRGKNVLIIGASKGIGYGSAQQFLKAGAQVIGTSRKPADYVDDASKGLEYSKHLSPVSLDITDGESVKRFFAESAVKDWAKIDILILGGFVSGSTLLAYSNASDLFPFINCELLGRQRVVSHCIRKMKDVPDSRIINLASIAANVPLMHTGPYSMCKAAETMWVKQFNCEAELLKQLDGGKEAIHTRAIAWQASWVDTTFSSFPKTLCPNPSTAERPVITSTMASGILRPYADKIFQGHVQGIMGNSRGANLTLTQAGDAMLFMASVLEPEWAYLVLTPDEQWCYGEGNVESFISSAGQHRSKAYLLKAFADYNIKAAFADIANGNTKKYGFYNCPPKGLAAPNVAPPEFRVDYPNCANADTTPLPVYNFTQARNVDDLVNNPCHAVLNCP